MSPLIVCCTLSIIGLSGFYTSTTDSLSEYVIPVEDGWGPEQKMTQPYCDIQKAFLLRMIDENGTTISTTKYMAHKYCNV